MDSPMAAEGGRGILEAPGRGAVPFGSPQTSARPQTPGPRQAVTEKPVGGLGDTKEWLKKNSQRKSGPGCKTARGPPRDLWGAAVRRRDRAVPGAAGHGPGRCGHTLLGQPRCLRTQKTGRRTPCGQPRPSKATPLFLPAGGATCLAL